MVLVIIPFFLLLYELHCTWGSRILSPNSFFLANSLPRAPNTTSQSFYPSFSLARPVRYLHRATAHLWPVRDFCRLPSGKETFPSLSSCRLAMLARGPDCRAFEENNTFVVVQSVASVYTVEFCRRYYAFKWYGWTL